MKTNFSTLSGKVSHLSTTSTVHGSVNKGKGRVNTSHETNFRVDGQAVVFNDSTNTVDGDHVTLIGKVKRGEFHARVLRNDETGVVYSGMTTLAYILGAVFIIIGIPTSFIIVGIPLIGAGIWLIIHGLTTRSAIKNLP